MKKNPLEQPDLSETSPLFPSAVKPVEMPTNNFHYEEGKDMKDFPLIPLAIKDFGRVIIEVIPPSEMKTRTGILLLEMKDNKFPLGRVLSLTEAMQPHLSVGDKVVFNHLAGHTGKLKFKNNFNEVIIMGNMDVVAKYVGDADGYYSGAVQGATIHKQETNPGIDDVGAVTHKPAVN